MATHQVINRLIEEVNKDIKQFLVNGSELSADVIDKINFVSKLILKIKKLKSPSKQLLNFLSDTLLFETVSYPLKKEFITNETNVDVKTLKFPFNVNDVLIFEDWMDDEDKYGVMYFWRVVGKMDNDIYFFIDANARYSLQ